MATKKKPEDNSGKSSEMDGGQPDAPKTVNKKYEEWRVEPKYEDVKDEMGKTIGRKLKEFEKLKMLRRTSISESTAIELNSQSENTGVRLFEVEE